MSGTDHLEMMHKAWDVCTMLSIAMRQLMPTNGTPDASKLHQKLNEAYSVAHRIYSQHAEAVRVHNKETK